MKLLFERRKKQEKTINNEIIRVPLNAKVPQRPEVQAIVAMALKRNEETLKRLGYNE